MVYFNYLVMKLRGLLGTGLFGGMFGAAFYKL